MMRRLAPLAAAAALAATPLPSLGAGTVLHREQSLYQNILVVREPTRLCLRFSVRRQTRNQSCVDPEDGRRMVFAYTRMMMALLLLEPAPERILVAGLGGGTLPAALAALLPEAAIDVVEIDPAVVAVAERYFGFATTARLRVVVADARVFVKRALARDDRYHAVLLDAYGGDYIPEHLLTREFLAEVRGLLGVGGVVAANTFSASRLYHHESATYQAVFGTFFNFKAPGSGNRIVLAANGSLPPTAVLEANAAAWRAPLAAYGVPIDSYPALLAAATAVDWDAAARPLTDQYAPANLLQDAARMPQDAAR